MASDNETVAEIIKWLRDKDYYRGYMGSTSVLTDMVIRHTLDRIEAAHNREVEKLDNVFHARHLNQMLHTSQSALEVEIVRNKKLEECLSRAINIICDKCDDMVRVKCICGEKKYCEVMRFRKALEENGNGRH